MFHDSRPSFSSTELVKWAAETFDSAVFAIYEQVRDLEWVVFIIVSILNREWCQSSAYFNEKQSNN